ncbi:MAG: CopG family ribbon-helix-helix protein [Actinomycetota bacterium]
MATRIHVTLDDELLRELDCLVGPRGRSPFIAEAISRAVEQERRWRSLKSAAGTISDGGHEWDEDPAAWVHAQRRADPRRIG